MADQTADAGQPSPAIQDFYPDDLAVCYGCGRLNAEGMHIRTYWDGTHGRATFQPKPFHTAIKGVVYGGLLASIVDCHAIGTGAAALYAAQGRELGSQPQLRCVTAKLEIEYLAPTPIDATLALVAWPLEVGRRSVVVAAEVRVGDLVTVTGKAVGVSLS